MFEFLIPGFLPDRAPITPLLQRYDFAIAHIPLSALPADKRSMEVCDDDAVIVSAFQKKRRRRK